MFAAADLVDLLAHELARLCCGRLAGALVLAGPFDCSLVRHGLSPRSALHLLRLVSCEDNESRDTKFQLGHATARYWNSEPSVGNKAPILEQAYPVELGRNFLALHPLTKYDGALAIGSKPNSP